MVKLLNEVNPQKYAESLVQQVSPQQSKIAPLPETAYSEPDYGAINDRALGSIDEVIGWLELNGKQVGREFQFLNPKREDGELGSCSVNIESGIWNDFADDDTNGGDLINLVAYLKDIQPNEAAKLLWGFLESSDNDPTQVANVSKKRVTQKQKPVDNLTLVIPVPADAPQPQTWFGNELGKPAIGFAYKDVSGNALGYILRFNTANGKTIRPLTLWKDNAGNMQWKIKGFAVPRPIYNLDQLAARSNEPVLVVEGEKSANAAMTLFPNHVVTTTMGGAQGVDKADLSPLYGRDVTIWPDNDEAGHKYAYDIAKHLHTNDGTTKVSMMNPLMYQPELIDGDKFKTRLADLPGGYDATDAITEGWTADLIGQLPANMFEVVKQADDELRFDDFLVNDKGVHLIKQGKENGDESYLRLSSRIDVVALTRDKNSKNWGKLIVLKDRDGHIHEWAMPSEMLSGGETYRQALLNMGADIPSNQLGKETLTRYLSSAEPSGRALCVNSIGWHRSVFVLPNKTFGQSAERVILQTSNALKVSPYAKNGTLSDWQNNIGSKCVDNSRMILAVCVSLSGPFLDIIKLENGGFHFRGQSSSGKTKTLTVAASIWGNKAMVRVWRATGNAIESLAREHNDTVLLLDELGQVDPKEAGDIAYTLGNGQTKARANINGDARETSNWRLLFISTGEIGLAEHVASGGGNIKAGQEVRMLDIPSDANAGMGVFENIHGAENAATFADSLQSMSEMFYGTPADALLNKLTEPGELERATTFIRQQQDQFVQQYVPVEAHGQVTRAATRFGAVAGVGEYCISIGILPWCIGHANVGVRECYLAWLESRGDNSASEEIRALEQVREYFERNGESRFTLIQPGVEDNVGQRTINRTGFRQVHNDGTTEYWVLPEMYRLEICAGFDPKLVTSVLKKHGYLEPDDAGKNSITKNVPGIGSQRVYIFKSNLMQRGGDM